MRNEITIYHIDNPLFLFFLSFFFFFFFLFFFLFSSVLNAVPSNSAIRLMTW